MTRKITSHLGSQQNDYLVVEGLDHDGQDKPCNRYVISKNNRDTVEPIIEIQFQTGYVLQTGVNGVSIESLLAVAKDRLETVQDTQHSHEYAMAITKLEEALMWIKKPIYERGPFWMF